LNNYFVGSSNSLYTWRKQKSDILRGLVTIEQQKANDIKMKKEGQPNLFKVSEKREKREKCIRFMTHNVENYADTIPSSEGMNKHSKPVKVIPHRDIKSYYDEYLVYCDALSMEKESIASYTTFSRAFRQFKKDKNADYELRLLRCKGSFNTCEICNNSTELLRRDKKIGGVKFTEEQRTILLEFRRLHLNQQQQERAKLELRKLKAKEYDARGNPSAALLYGDGMTQFTCLSPRFGEKGAYQHSHETRFISFQVVCGPIDTVFTYRTDSMILETGANIMIELMRQALIDLSKLLEGIKPLFNHDINFLLFVFNNIRS